MCSEKTIIYLKAYISIEKKKKKNKKPCLSQLYVPDFFARYKWLLL